MRLKLVWFRLTEFDSLWSQTSCAFTDVSCLRESPAAPQLPLALLIGLLLFLVEKKSVGSLRMLISPSVLLITTVGFQLAQMATGEESSPP